MSTVHEASLAAATDRSPSSTRLSFRPLALLAILCAAILPYIVTLSFGYTYDDVVISEEPSRHTLRAVWHAWVESYWGNKETGLYRPFAQSLFALMWNLGGGHPLIFHVFVLALHVVTTLLVWVLLQRALSRPAAALGALLFAADPVHVEAIGSIANSTEIMVTLLAIGMVLVICRMDADDRPPAPARWGVALLAGLLYLLALGAKESAGTLPALALVCWWGWRAPKHDAPAGAGFLRTIARGWRIWIVATAVLAAAVSARYLVLGRLAVNPDFVAPGIRETSAIHRVYTMLAAWPLVGKLLFWPDTLLMHYGKDIVVPQTSLTRSAVLSLVVVALALAGAIAAARRGDRRPLAAIAWIALAYLPASNLLVPTGQLLAERTMYLPSVGAAMLAAWGLERIARAAARAVPRRGAELAVALPALAVATLGARKSSTAILPWQDSYTLFVSGIDAMPNSARPYWLLGNWYNNHGNRTRALAYLAHAHKLDPADPVIVYYYVNALHTAGEYETELGVLRDAVGRIHTSEPIRVMFLTTLGERRGADSVIAFLHDARAGWVSSYWRAFFLAAAYRAKGMLDSMRAVYRSAIAEQPGDTKLRYAYAQTLERAKLYDEAERQLALVKPTDHVPPAAIVWLRSQIALGRGDTVGARRIVAAAKAEAPKDTAIAHIAAQLDSTLAHPDTSARNADSTHADRSPPAAPSSLLPEARDHGAHRERPRAP